MYNRYERFSKLGKKAPKILLENSKATTKLSEVEETEDSLEVEDISTETTKDSEVIENVEEEVAEETTDDTEDIVVEETPRKRGRGRKKSDTEEVSPETTEEGEV